MSESECSSAPAHASMQRGYAPPPSPAESQAAPHCPHRSRSAQCCAAHTGKSAKGLDRKQAQPIPPGMQRRDWHQPGSSTRRTKHAAHQVSCLEAGSVYDS